MSERNSTERNSWQIAKYQTDKKLIESVDKLEPASSNFYAHIHANGERDERGRKHSLIGLNLLDYTNGKGDKTVSVSFNLSPEQVAFWFDRARTGHKTFELKQDKIIAAQADKKTGIAPVYKLIIKRSETGYDGKPSRYPWYICVETGIGLAQANDNGSYAIKSGSYKSEKKVFINLNDVDMYAFLRKTVKYMEAWETWTAYNLLEKSGKVDFIKPLLRDVMLFIRGLVQKD